MEITVTYNGFNVAEAKESKTAKIDEASMHSKIDRIEAALREAGTIELTHKDYFSKGLYARELHIPKGTVLSGKIHKYTNLNIMSKGELSVLTENGIERVKAPFTIVSPAGTRRVAYAHEDTVWTTIHATDKTDVDEIEDEVVVKTYGEYLSFCEQLKIEGQ